MDGDVMVNDQERRLRLLHILVQPVVVWDDGSEIGAGPSVQPQSLSVAGVRDLLDYLPEHLAELERQTDTVSTDQDEHGILPCSDVHPAQDIHHPGGHLTVR